MVIDVIWRRLCICISMEYLFVLGWASVRRVRCGSVSSELLMCGGGVYIILILPLVARCLETMMYVYGACLFLCLL